jgi:asparagine synthase (glutamine-hydrolysing)
MCGIAGWISWEQDLSGESATVERMAQAVRHRGPDGQGVWLSPRAALAHRRLIVIDAETGGQPMVYQQGEQTVVITFNGELYNFQELRRELEGKGHRFKTRSDTEVLLHGYVEWGEDCVQHLNGIFAFAIWDEARRRLFLARDHLGVKPLFYAQRGASIFFGSEIKALLAHPAVRPVVNSEGLANIFSNVVHAPGFTVFQGIQEVAAGHRISFEPGRTTVKRYWSLRSAPHPDGLDATVDHLRALLCDTVSRQLVADVPVVTMLSGGLDSSGITALAAREFERLGRRLSSYSIDFVDHASHFAPDLTHLSLDTPWALQVAEYLGTDQHTVVVDSDELLENLLLPTMAHDKPAFGQAESSLYLFCKAIKRDATVALSGESADEVFGGYYWFFLPDAVNGDTFPWLAPPRGGRRSGAPPYLSAELLAKASPEAYVARCYAEALDEVPRLAGESADEARRREILFLNQTRFLPIVLDRKDRMSMAVGLEVRVPFCDYRLVEYVWNIPWAMKAVDDIEKGILRRAFSDVLPKDVLYRKKNPYPLTQNPAYLAAIRELVLQLIGDPNAAIRPFIEATVLRAMTEIKHPQLNALFERMLQIEGWLRKYRIEIA